MSPSTALAVDPYQECKNLLRGLLLDFGHLSYTRHMFSAFENASNAGNSFWLLSPLLPFQLWLITNYMVTCLSAIRRQVDTDADAASLVKFLGLLVQNAQIITRSGFKALYPASEQSAADRLFDQLVEPGASVMTPKMVGLDKTAFPASTKSLATFATRRIAHLLQEDGLDAELTRINACIDLALIIFSKYLTLSFGPEAPPINRPMPPELLDTLDSLFKPYRP